MGATHFNHPSTSTLPSTPALGSSSLPSSEPATPPASTSRLIPTEEPGRQARPLPSSTRLISNKAWDDIPPTTSTGCVNRNACQPALPLRANLASLPKAAARHLSATTSVVSAQPPKCTPGHERLADEPTQIPSRQLLPRRWLDPQHGRPKPTARSSASSSRDCHRNAKADAGTPEGPPRPSPNGLQDGCFTHGC